jgi:selenide,water dikinase
LPDRWEALHRFGIELYVWGNPVRRLLSKQETVSTMASSPASQNLVLLGIGHTNADFVRRWIDDPISGCRLTCVSRYATATYSGMLPGVLGGQAREEEMKIDLRALARRARAELVIGDVSGLNLETRQLVFADRTPIPFDALSIGVGSMPACWDQHRHSRLLVPIKPMQTFLQRLEERLAACEGGRPLRISIVGGGVAGVEVAFCLDQHCRRAPGKREVSIEILTSGDRVAEGMRDRSARRIVALLNRRGIAIRYGHRVVEVGDSSLTTDDGVQHESDCVIWMTGAAPPAVLGRLGLATDDRGFIATKSTLQAISDQRIFAVGDCGTVLDTPFPKAGVYAVRESPILWHNLRAVAAGQSLIEFRPQPDFLKLLNTGDEKALLEYGRVTCHARWCRWLKRWIDRRFVEAFHV